jgi:putative transposase
MPRPARADEAGAIYHALNRGNARQTILHKEEDFAAFERVIGEGLERFDVKLFSYQWMSNHWHMILSPQLEGEMSRFLYWITMTHTARYHAHYDTVGEGHVYQGRYKSFPIEDDVHFLTACRYVERNALAASLVLRAEDWRWGSLWNWCVGESVVKLSSWPVGRLPNWIERVNMPMTAKEEQQFKQSLERGSPFGNEDWVRATVQRLGLESTQRSRGRPRKFT